MKLSKLYSNNKTFKTVLFNSNLNVILADVKAQKDEKKNSHCLGKTLLSEVIDFMLLKSATNKHWLISSKDKVTKDSVFNKYEFYLEILLDNGMYLTIKRSVAQATKISFKLHLSENRDFSNSEEWDITNMQFDKAKAQLNKYLDFDFFRGKTEYDYRKSINYSLRLQGDYDDIFQLKKFKGKDKNWKPFMFDFLGFDGGLLSHKYAIQEQIEEIKVNIKNQERDFAVKSNEKDKLVGQIQIKQEDKSQLSKELDNFNFYKQDRNLISDLVESIEKEISELNTVDYNLDFDIRKLKESILNEFSFDLEAIKQIFEETELYFPDKLIKSYEDLVDFNKKLSVERNKHLHEQLQECIGQQKDVRKKLVVLNEKKQEYRDVIQDTTLFKKYKLYQRELIQIEGELARLETQLVVIDNFKSKEEEIKELQEKYIAIVDNITDITNNTLVNQKYTNIRNTFARIVKQILQAPAVISVKLNKQNNIEFNYGIEATAQAKGYTYKKLLCVAFDLAILINYSTESYYRFVYHDDVFSNQDNRLKLRLLDVITNVCNKYDIQYIFTIIKDDIPRDEKEQLIKFTDSEIVLKLNDKDDKGKLFEMTF